MILLIDGKELWNFSIGALYIVNLYDNDMRTRIVIFIFMLMLILMSCDGPQMKLDQSVNISIPEWRILEVESQNQTIIIDRYKDYGVRDTCDLQEVKIDEYITEYRPLNRGQEYFDISPQEKDSLFKYVYDIVSNPVYTDQYATCYVGNVSISFSVCNTTQACKYNSVGNWTTISYSTKRLYDLLSKKTKISES